MVSAVTVIIPVELLSPILSLSGSANSLTVNKGRQRRRRTWVKGQVHPMSPLSCHSESAGQQFTPELTPRHSLNQPDQTVWRWGSGTIIFRPSGWFQCASRLRTAGLEGWGRVGDGAASALGPGAWAAGGHVGWGGLGWRGVSDGRKATREGKEEEGTRVGRA